MAQIQRQEVIQEVVDGLRLDAGRDVIPSRSGDLIQPVFIANPKVLVDIISGTASDALTATLVTVSDVKKTFLTYLMLSVAKSVGATSTNSRINFFPKGKPLRAGVLIRYEPVTAGDHTQAVSFNPPILLEKGSIITVTNSAAMGSIDASATVGFFEVEP